MTTGLWVLDFVWMNTQDHEEFNKWGGVAMGIVGAILIAPQASKNFGKWLVGQPLTRLAQATQSLLNRIRGRELTQVTATVTIFNEPEVGRPSVTQTLPWDEDAAIEQKIQWLKSQLEHLNDIWRARAKRLEEIDQLTNQDVALLTTRVYGELEGLQEKIEKIQRDSVMIDATGLLPIVAGLILTGVPEALASWGPWGWVVWFAGAAATIGAVIKSWRSKIWW
ncbi:hypothetical protein [Paenarthrobacter aurescens]|uniref:hypothetical protein n=1 Tax=Paenarthrobacter aurescens TaxID=43663 RepID=UPI0021C10EBD|nr:hypothetical protein [Paenarthrobacter aurescens]MCT9868993.1 hypothetical protein [Paenarthrobacter aurescens]